MAPQRPQIRQRRPDSGRRGNFAILFAMAIPVIVGFGALSIDTSFIRLAQSQTQDVADAASQAALIELRRTGDVSLARQAAEDVVALNNIGGQPGELTQLEFGAWDEDADPNSSDPLLTAEVPNAARAWVARRGNNSVPLHLSTLWGYESFEVERMATSASRKLQVIVVLDITNSWSSGNFNNARLASLTFFDTISASHGPEDQMGMTVFTNRFGWEFSPLTDFKEPATVASMRADWDGLRTASKAGFSSTWPGNCNVHGDPNRNNFNYPAGGCYPNMPREYLDEPGTDHTTGMMMAWKMFEDEYDPTAFRAMVVLTDGTPNGLNNPGTARGNDGYVEERWREYAGPAPRGANTIRAESIRTAEAMWDDLQVHTFVVSFVADDSFMHAMPQGQGYYVNTSDSAALVPIFRDIANSLPLALVE